MIPVTTSSSSASPRPRRRAWRRHRYPARFIERRQETVIALLFGLVGLVVTAIALLNAESLMCALGDWTEECARLVPPPDE
jgi:hypothetical protein